MASPSYPRDAWQNFRGTYPFTIPDTDVPGADLTGKWVIISGANSGIGFEAAKSFAKWGANLVLACREPAAWEMHPTAAVEQCTAAAKANGHDGSSIEWWEIDMAKIATVEAFCAKWLATGRALDILCNNAGRRPAGPTTMTSDGFQALHQVNFLSHVLLTLRLLPTIARAEAPRIVCTTSCMHHQGHFDLEHFNGGEAMPGGEYQNNKLYFQMWVADMQARLLRNPAYAHIVINGIHPGFVYSNIWHGIGSYRLGRLILNLLLTSYAIDSQQGSLAITNAATNPQLTPQNGGKYFNRIWEAPHRPYCDDADARQRLWDKLDEALGLGSKGLLKGLSASV